MTDHDTTGCEYMPGARVRYRDEPEVQGTVTSAFTNRTTGAWLYAIQWDYPKGFTNIIRGDVLELGTLPAEVDR